MSRKGNGREMRISSREEEDNLIVVPSVVRTRSPEFKFQQERLMRDTRENTDKESTSTDCQEGAKIAITGGFQEQFRQYLSGMTQLKLILPQGKEMDCMTSGLPSHFWFLWFGDLVLFTPFIPARPRPALDHRPKQGTTHQGRGTARLGYTADP